MFILVDAEDRENEGDLVIPAQMCTPQAINFMARYGRGLICLAMTQERADQLKLPMMAAQNGTRNQTAFTVSIEAKEGISTGISAHDRAHTISVAIDPTKGPDDIVMPGHVFPLVARHGGVLVRTGHTEAAVDIARLGRALSRGRHLRDHERRRHDGAAAGSGEIRAAPRPQSRHHRRSDRLPPQARPFRPAHEGNRFREPQWRRCSSSIVYLNTIENQEHVALVKGDISGPEPPLVRMHAYNLFDDTLAAKWGQGDVLGESMRMIGEAGRGVVVLIRRNRIAPVSEVLAASARPTLGRARHSRLKEYGVGAQILIDLGIESMVLLTNTPGRRVVALEGYGLKIVETRPVMPGTAK